MEIILPIIDQEKCTLCGNCIEQCPDHVLEKRDDQIVFIDSTRCSYCGECETDCAQGAIRVEYEITW